MKEYLGIDVPNDTLATCSGGAGHCDVLKEDPTTGYFGYSSGWTDTHFVRQIQIISISTNEVQVNVTISWKSGIFTKTFTVQQTLFNWH